MSKNLQEDLNVINSSIDPIIAEKAAKKGLQHVGFGKFENPVTGQITHVERNGKLVPYNTAIQTNSYKNENSDEFGAYSQLNAQNVDMLHDALSNHYSADKHSSDEIKSLQHFTNLGYDDINNKLSSLPAGINPNKLQLQSADDETPKHISNLDSATKKHRAPFDFTTYVKLGPDHDLLNFQPGKTIKFKGFRNTSIAPENIINIPNENSKSTAVLQINVKKNARGVYAHDFSPNPKGDFILPRGARLHIASGPHKIVGSNAATDNPNQEVVYYNAVHKS